jgi:hypothetical protein
VSAVGQFPRTHVQTAHTPVVLQVLACAAAAQAVPVAATGGSSGMTGTLPSTWQLAWRSTSSSCTR